MTFASLLGCAFIQWCLSLQLCRSLCCLVSARWQPAVYCLVWHGICMDCVLHTGQLLLLMTWVSCLIVALQCHRYVAKLRKQLEDACAEIFSSTDDRERIKSVLSDLSKTAADFKQIVSRAAESFVAGLMPRVRYRCCSVILSPAPHVAD